MAEHDLGERAAFADEITAKTAARVRSYFDSRYDWNLLRSLKNLVEQAIRDYEHRAVLELVQNAHDAQSPGARRPNWSSVSCAGPSLTRSTPGARKNAACSAGQ